MVRQLKPQIESDMRGQTIECGNGSKNLGNLGVKFIQIPSPDNSNSGIGLDVPLFHYYQCDHPINLSPPTHQTSLRVHFTACAVPY